MSTLRTILTEEALPAGGQQLRVEAVGVHPGDDRRDIFAGHQHRRLDARLKKPPMTAMSM